MEGWLIVWLVGYFSCWVGWLVGGLTSHSYAGGKRHISVLKLQQWGWIIIIQG